MLLKRMILECCPDIIASTVEVTSDLLLMESYIINTGVSISTSYIHNIGKNGITEELLNAGVIVQTNGEAVISSTSRKNILKMINIDKIHLLGSDCHNMSDRPPNLDGAFQIISKRLGKSALGKIDSNGRKILNDELI